MKTVLITGASSGIGKCFTELFAKDGYNIVLAARRLNVLNEIKKDLEERYSINCYCVESDLSKKDSPKALYDYCVENGIDVDVLVNNAGYGDYSPFTDAEINKVLEMIDLNDRSLVELSYLFARDMKEKRSGNIINIGSIASFLPGPYMAVYYASKSFVLNFSLAIREELKDYGVGVTCLCPGPTKTAFFDVAGANIGTVFEKYVYRNAEKCAEYGYKLFKNNRAYGVDGAANAVAVFFSRLVPVTLVAKAVKLVQSKIKH